MFKHRWRLLASLAVIALGLGAWALFGATRTPERWTITEGVPAAAQASAQHALGAGGYTLRGLPAWAAPAGRADRRYRLFFVAEQLGAGGDLYQAQADLEDSGQTAQVSAVTRLTDTPHGSEDLLAAGEAWLAYATRVAGHYQSITCVPLADPGRRVVFVFDSPIEQLELAWQQPAGGAGDLLTARLGGRADTLVQINPAAPAELAADAGLSYTPAVRGEQAWLPNLVSRVRELPGVGPEKIAFAENIYFTAVDRLDRWFHGIRPSSPAPAPEATPPTMAQAVPTHMPVVVSTAVIEAAPVIAAAATPGEAATVLPADPSPIPVSATVAPTAIPPTPVPSPTQAPAALAPPTPVLRALAEGVTQHPSVRPDPQRPYAEVEVIHLEPRLLQIKMVPGTIEPKPTTGLLGTGVIPQEQWGQLVVGFNGGFAAMHGMFGMMVDRKVYLPARDGIATLAIYEDGSLRMGTWGKDLSLTSDMVSYRQNCPPLIEGGMITAETGKLTLWGLSVSNEVYLYRSGLGLTADGQLIYVAGKSLSAYTLARALQLAGAQYAMQLDVDEYHVAFITYQVTPGQPPSGRKLRADMRGFDGLFLRPFQLDFFYMLRRPQPLAQAVRTGAPAPAALTPAETTGPARPELPGRIAFASNRDGNWDIYLLEPGSDAPPGRLTDDPADDLYPAWSPDGKRLAFTSRRSGNAEIYVLDLASRQLQQVTHLPSEEWAATWSPDGTRLAYQTDRNGQSDIYVSLLGGDGQAVREMRLTEPDGNHEAPDYAPDGQAIVFDSDLDVSEAVHASINIYIMNADGSNPRRVIAHGESPRWGPDGHSLLFTGLRGGHWQVLGINRDGGGYRQLTNGPYDARYPAWSPDGRWVAFAGNQDGRWQLYVMPAAGGRPQPLTGGSADNSYPAWSK